MSVLSRRSVAGLYVRINPDTLLKSADGNWNDDNLHIGNENNVLTGVLFGLNQEGTGGEAQGYPAIYVGGLGNSSDSF